MFCLSLNGFEESLVDEMVHRESLNTLALDGYHLLWRDDDSVHIERTKHYLRILMDDPAVGERKEYLRVNFASRRVSAHRPWPGSKSIYFRSNSGLLITTHLRLAASYGAAHGPAPRLMNAGETITFQREGHRQQMNSPSVGLPRCRSRRLRVRRSRRFVRLWERRRATASFY
jgi:hypothetical protein